MRRWLFMLGGLLIWAAHFFLLYGLASSFPGEDIAPWLAIAATIAALAANAAIIWFALPGRATGDPLESWIDRVALCGALLSFLAVLWQGFPAVA